LCTGLALLHTLALCLLVLHGHLSPALSLGVLLWRALPPILRDDSRGSLLVWHRGTWELSGTAGRGILLLEGSHTPLPSVAHLAFRTVADGRPCSLWVFADSVEPDAWRRLRVRLALADSGFSAGSSAV